MSWLHMRKEGHKLRAISKLNLRILTAWRIIRKSQISTPDFNKFGTTDHLSVSDNIRMCYVKTREKLHPTINQFVCISICRNVAKYPWEVVTHTKKRQSRLVVKITRAWYLKPLQISCSNLTGQQVSYHDAFLSQARSFLIHKKSYVRLGL